MMDKTVGELATREFWRVAPDDTADAIADEMVARRLTWVPVLEHGILVGVVSAWDLLHLRARGQAGDTPAWRVCTYKPLAVAEDTPAHEAARLMRDSHVHHLLVTSPERTVVGIVSPLDLLVGHDRNASDHDLRPVPPRAGP